MVIGPDRLMEIEAQLRKGESVNSVSVRSFLGWFGAQRRSHLNVWRIRNALLDANLDTRPDFESAYIDSEIQFELFENGEDTAADVPTEVGPVSAPEATSQPLPAVAADPTYRIANWARQIRSL